MPTGASTQPVALADAEGLYREADRLLHKKRMYLKEGWIEDARQEMVLAALEGRSMASTLRSFYRREGKRVDPLVPLPEEKL